MIDKDRKECKVRTNNNGMHDLYLMEDGHIVKVYESIPLVRAAGIMEEYMYANVWRDRDV